MKSSTIQASLVRSSKRFLQTVQQPSASTSVSPMVFGATHLNHSTASNLEKKETSTSKWTTYSMPKVGSSPLERKPFSIKQAQPSQQLRQSKPLQTTPTLTTTTNTSTPLQTTTNQPKSTAAPRRKLRPRKAAISLSQTAISHLQGLLNQPEPKLIRIGVKNRGCSGLTYHLEYVDKPGKFDEEIVQDGVKVLIDSKALFSIIGSEMDWVDDKLSSRFVFHNPNSKGQCGCGESFMV